MGAKILPTILVVIMTSFSSFEHYFLNDNLNQN